MKYTLTGLCLLLTLFMYAQETATISGKVTDADTEDPIELASVKVSGTSIGVLTDDKGRYELVVPANQNITIEYSFVNYKMFPLTLRLGSNEKKRQNVALQIESGAEIVVTDSGVTEREGDGVTADVRELKLIPTISQTLESVLPSIGLGTSSGTGGELSSQYSVRGGNYDENLVYVNDFEIYRPFLVRSGQQEGLTFPNIDLIRDISFSSGGFDARYGDKMSSVLNITYKRPTKFKGSFGASALGGSAHIEGSIAKKSDSTGVQRLRYLFGMRYKTTRYLLGSLDLQGEYAPNFTDVQGMITYDLNPELQLELIGNYSRSVFNFVPETLSSTLGLVNFALQFRVAFDGSETDDFNTGMGGASLTYIPEGKNYFLKLLASSYQSQENERFDLIGQYLLGELETDLGSSQLGEIVSILGVGTEQNFARNYLTANVTNVQHKGGWEWENNTNDKAVSHFVQWGARFQNEQIFDQLNEWERLDSAGYSVPYSTEQVILNEVIKTDISLQSNRFSAYVQNTWNHKDSTKDLSWTVGIRGQYWDLNNELIISPRTTLLYKPLQAEKDISFKAAVGFYHQPPFYRELRNLEGEVNEEVLSQKSLHVVFGYTYDFLVYKKKFRLIGEAYYKHLWDVVPYDIDNVRIRYYGDNLARGYVTGVDFRLNGEFVPGAESWINLSFLRARENFLDTQHQLRTVGLPDSVQNVNDVPRPTDRFFNLSMFFQDYLPQNKNFKMHMNLSVGSGLPFGLPENNVLYRNTYRFNPYHRIDIGFSAQLWNEDMRMTKPGHPFRAFENAWVSLEIFNLMQVANTASNTWIKTVFNQQFAIPNRLTSRRINLRLKFEW